MWEIADSPEVAGVRRITFNTPKGDGTHKPTPYGYCGIICSQGQADKQQITRFLIVVHGETIVRVTCKGHVEDIPASIGGVNLQPMISAFVEVAHQYWRIGRQEVRLSVLDALER